MSQRSQRPQPSQYGNYYDQQHHPNENASNVNHAAERRNTRRDFLNRKYEVDLQNVRIWRIFTIIASATGVALMLVGITFALYSISGGLVGTLAGVMSALAGALTTIFLHLVHKPAEKAHEQLQHTLEMIVEEERREEQHLEELRLLEKLDEAGQKEYIKRRLFNSIPSAGSTSPDGASGATGKQSQSQETP